MKLHGKGSGLARLERHVTVMKQMIGGRCRENIRCEGEVDADLLTPWKKRLQALRQRMASIECLPYGNRSSKARDC